MKLIAFFLFPFFVFLLQFGFLPAAFPSVVFPNLLMGIVIFYTLMEDPNKDGAFFLALYAGFLHETLTFGFFGGYIIIFFAIAYFLKYILKNYVQIPFLGKA